MLFVVACVCARLFQNCKLSLCAQGICPMKKLLTQKQQKNCASHFHCVANVQDRTHPCCSSAFFAHTLTMVATRSKARSCTSYELRNGSAMKKTQQKIKQALSSSVPASKLREHSVKTPKTKQTARKTRQPLAKQQQQRKRPGKGGQV